MSSEEKSKKKSGSSKIFSLIETLGMFCLYSGIASLIIAYLWRYGFTWQTRSRGEYFDLLVWAARGGLIFALVFGLPIWLAREYGGEDH